MWNEVVTYARQLLPFSLPRKDFDIFPSAVYARIKRTPNYFEGKILETEDRPFFFYEFIGLFYTRYILELYFEIHIMNVLNENRIRSFNLLKCDFRCSNVGDYWFSNGPIKCFNNRVLWKTASNQIMHYFH